MHPDARKWKRHFMSSEHNKRKQKRIASSELFEMEIKLINSKREIQTLKEQVQRSQGTVKGQHKVIVHLQQLLQDHSIPQPAFTQVASFKTCRADEDEMCPLSLQSINASLPPYDATLPLIDLDPRKPHHKCAELMCGHRFNGLWLLFHFVARSTARCPICRRGHEDFNFQLEQLPSGLIDRVRDLMGHKKQGCAARRA